jgi:cysteine desulfurase/selenocysteine lyase
MFDKRHEWFPVKDRYLFLSHCSVAPLYRPAFERERELAERHCQSGVLSQNQYDAILDGLRQAAAAILRTADDNLAFVKNTTEGMSLIANGYPFQPGDQIISYVNEYPANHYPWKLQERRGVELVLLPDRDITGKAPAGMPVAWTMSDLEALVTPRTRVVALSHVQFTSGYVADLKSLAGFCQARNIDLVLDVAQSLGCLPVYPDELGVAAAVSSGWKWLLGPVGTGLLYTAPALRRKLAPVMVGAESMRQGIEYLNHVWDPFDSAKVFEYSTSPLSLAGALETCIREIPLRYGLEAIEAEIYRLQDIFLSALDKSRFRPVFESSGPRTPIVSLIVPDGAPTARRQLVKQNMICTDRGGYLRIAPHFYNTDDEMARAAGLLNALGIVSSFHPAPRP